jgi:hypothetical protein
LTITDHTGKEAEFQQARKACKKLFKGDVITMNEAIKTLLNRRSIRKFKPEQIKDDELNIVLAYERETHKAEHSSTCKGDL